MKTYILSGLFFAAIGCTLPASASIDAREGLFKRSFHKQERLIHKRLVKKYGYSHISQMGITKSDVHKSKYYVQFTNDNQIYNAYFNRWGKMSQLKKVAELSIK